MAEPEVLQEKAPKLHTAQQRIAEKKTAPADLDRGAIDEAKEEVDKKFGALAKDVRETSIKRMREDRDIMKENMPKKEANETTYLKADANYQAVDSLVNQMVSIDNDQNKTLEDISSTAKDLYNDNWLNRRTKDLISVVDSHGAMRTLGLAAMGFGIAKVLQYIWTGIKAPWHWTKAGARKVGIISKQPGPEMTEAELQSHISYMQGQLAARKKAA